MNNMNNNLNSEGYIPGIPQQSIDPECMNRIVEHLSNYLDGPEQGVATVADTLNHRDAMIRLLREKGYNPWGVWLRYPIRY